MAALKKKVLEDRVNLELRALQETEIPPGKNALVQTERRNGRIAALQDVLGWLVDETLEADVEERISALGKRRPKRRSAPAQKAAGAGSKRRRG
jgi:hypothetical protein